MIAWSLAGAGRFLVRGGRGARRAGSGRVCDLGGGDRLHEAPFSEVTYAYPWRPAARVSLDGLPEPMRHELAWWLWSLHGGGERVNSWTLQAWVRVAAALAADPERAVGLVRLPVGRGVDARRAATVL